MEDIKGKKVRRKEGRKKVKEGRDESESQKKVKEVLDDGWEEGIDGVRESERE